MNKVYIIVTFFLSLCGIARAEDVNTPEGGVRGKSLKYKHEITGGIDATVGFVRFNFVTASNTQYALAGAYAYSISRSFQAGIQFNISDSGGAIDPFRYAFYFPLTYNWGSEDLRDNFFVRVAPGFLSMAAIDGALLLQAGKRFKLLENLSWRPTLGLAGYFGNGAARTALDIIPLVFSIVF